MSASSWPTCIRFTRKAEGGFGANPDDPGNWTGGAIGSGVCKGTKFGISAAAYPGTDIAALTEADASAIYRRDYWHPVHGDELPAGVDLMAFDFGVNAGPGRSVRLMQEAVGVTVDGMIGPETLGALKDASRAITAMAKAQERHYRDLSDFAEFGHGWLDRLDERQALAEQMARGEAS